MLLPRLEKAQHSWRLLTDLILEQGHSTSGFTGEVEQHEQSLWTRLMGGLVQAQETSAKVRQKPE